MKLDAIPADLIDSVEINKTLSPSQEGDAIGGSVNLVTKRAGERPTATFQAMGGYSVNTTLSGVTFNGPSTMDIREYKFYRHRYGFAGSADYKLGEASLLYLRGLFSNFMDHGED